MASLTKAQMKQVVEQWKRAAPELERIRREELENWEYDWETVDALLELGDRFGQSRPTSGLVEMQKWFMKLAERQGLRPRTARRRRAAPGSEKRAEK